MFAARLANRSFHKYANRYPRGNMNHVIKSQSVLRPGMFLYNVASEIYTMVKNWPVQATSWTASGFSHRGTAAETGRVGGSIRIKDAVPVMVSPRPGSQSSPQSGDPMSHGSHTATCCLQRDRKVCETAAWTDTPRPVRSPDTLGHQVVNSLSHQVRTSRGIVSARSGYWPPHR